MFISWHWRCHWRVDCSFKPVRGTLYKPACWRCAGDMHGTAAVHAFVSILNPHVKDGCIFCEWAERNHLSLFYISWEVEPSVQTVESDFRWLFIILVFIYGFKKNLKKKKNKRRKKNGRLIDLIYCYLIQVENRELNMEMTVIWRLKN